MNRTFNQLSQDNKDRVRKISLSSQNLSVYFDVQLGKINIDEWTKIVSNTCHENYKAQKNKLKKIIKATAKASNYKQT